MALLTNMTLCVSTVSVIIVVLVGNVSKNPVCINGVGFWPWS